ncbi:MAG TPA: hypothetical protein VK928_01535 [Longimicrobiales bacterium]|nr:hypothetical protein [Longimicrobiales bacterium]
MRKIRASFHFALTVVGTVLIAYAITSGSATRDRLLIGALGLVFLEAGVWRITQSLFPNERAYAPLRKETDFFITLVRRLNTAAVAAQRGSPDAAPHLARIHADMHHSVDRMLRLAGLTDADLGYSYRPRKSPLPADERLAALHPPEAAAARSTPN